MSVQGTDFSDFSGSIDGLLADQEEYYFSKMCKKGISVTEVERVYHQYREAGFSSKISIAMTDRTFFPNPHKSGHGATLKR